MSETQAGTAVEDEVAEMVAGLPVAEEGLGVGLEVAMAGS